MIKEDFNTSLDFLRQENMPFNRSISNDMNVTQFNSIFTELEEYLNNLYEKIRVLEEVHDYTLNFVKTAIEERRRQIMSDLKIIEMSVDSLSENNCITRVVDFTDYTDQITDRNGETLSHLLLDNGDLTLDMSDIYRGKINEITNTGEFIDIDKKIDDDIVSSYCRYSEGLNYSLIPLEDNSFRDQLLSFQPIRTEIRYEIFFSENQIKSNYLNFTPVNCEVVDIKIIDGDDMSTDISRGIFEEQYVQKVVLRIKPINYEMSDILIPSHNRINYFDSPIDSNSIAEEAILC